MSELVVERRYIDGAWRYVLRDEGASPVASGPPMPPGPFPDTPSLAAVLGCDLIGGGNVALSNGAECDLCEIAVWTRFLDKDERQQVADYLAVKWAAI